MARQNPVGVIGVGLMGEVFARRLIAARLAESAGRPARSMGGGARAADPIVLAVFDTDQVEQVVEKDLLPILGAAPKQVVLCTSTCDPDRIAALGGRVGA